jgi:phosphatidate cytidylyltransferase
MFARTLTVVVAGFGLGALLMLVQRRTSGSATRTAWGKYITYLLFVAGVLVVAEIGEAPFATFVFAILAAALIEFYRASRMPKVAAIALAIAGLAIAVAALMGGAAALYPAVLVTALATLAFGAFAADPRSGGRASVWGVAGIVAVAAPGSHLLLLAGHNERFALFAFLFLVVCGADAFAELTGRRWPLRRGILPASPNKTLGGLLGGLAAALAIALSLNLALGLWSGAQALAFGFALALAGGLGDLVASSMKRALDIKDFGSSLPRHGGVLDRFDSLIFAAVPYYWMTGG